MADATSNSGALVPASRHQTAPGASQALSLTAMSVQDAWGFAKALAESSILPRQYQNNPGSVLWALEFGRGLGLDVITTIQSVHIIQGKATMSADLMASLCRRAGHRMRVSGDESKAVVVIFRADDREFPFEVSWTMDRARQANLVGKDTWKQYPAAMLRARAISECVRMACPEVLHGAIYTPEEIGATVDADTGAPVYTATQQPSQPAQSGAVQVGNVTVDRDCFVPEPQAQGIADRAQAATDRDTVKALWAEGTALLNAGILAPDTGEPDMLSAYLTRRGQSLPAAAEQQAPAAEDDVADAEIVEEQAALDPAIVEAFMEKVYAGWDNVDSNRQTLIEARHKKLADAVVPGPDGQPAPIGALLEGRIVELGGSERAAA